MFPPISEKHGFIGTYKLIMDLQQLNQNRAMLQTGNSITASFAAISRAGGPTGIAGDILILMNHGIISRDAIALGAGAGILLSVLLATTLIPTRLIAVVLTEYSIIGWTE